MIAWSAHNYDLVTGSGTALNFPVVLVNKVAAWESNRTVVPVTGTYFIEMIGRTAANGSIDMKLMLNTNIDMQAPIISLITSMGYLE